MTESNLDKNQKQATHSGDSDIVSFWLLLLFVAVFFGIAAEEARHPMFGNRALENQATHSPIASALHQIEILDTDNLDTDKKMGTTK